MAATWRQSVGAALARLQRGFARMWAKVKKVFHVNRSAGWGGPPRDDAHAYYRTQYERMVDTLPNTPRIKTNETTQVFLAFSQVLQQLHEYGDDPIPPPGVRRVVREHDRLAAFGAVGAPSGVLGRMVAMLGPLLPYALIGGLLLSVTGWGTSLWNGWRAERLEDQRDAARETAQANYEAAESWRRMSEHYRQGLVDAATIARQAADALAAERQAEARRAARERRRNRDIQNVLVGSPEPPAWRLRDAEPADEGGPAAPSP